MGNSSSYEGREEDDEYAEQFDGVETLGYRVLGVQPNSPASKAGLVSFFDFIVGANQQMLLGSGEGLEEGEEYDDVDFPALLRENVDKPVELLVWNIKAQDKRVVQLIPRSDWGGAGLLGVTIKLDDYGGADERLVRVLEVEEHSPAAVAGLIPEQDFLLGTTACALQSADVLARVLMENVDRVVELYVYNSTSDMVRIVGLLPTYSWGDHNSLLGAEVGTGYLHRLPATCRATIGQSVERRVQVLNQIDDGRNTNLNRDTFQMEHHLEMEVDDDDSEAGAEESIRQPHQLGRLEKDIMGRSVEAQESMRSISLASEAEQYSQDAPSEQLSAAPVEQASMPTAASTDETTEQMTADEIINQLTEAGSSTTEGEVGQSSQESVPMPSFPEAAPVRHIQSEYIAQPPAQRLPSPYEPSTPSHPPPPPPQDSASSTPPPPPPQAVTVTSPPLPPPPAAASDTKVETVHDEQSEEDETDHEEESEEETDEEEYETDSEDEEKDGDSAPPSGGLFSRFMPAPPKMHY